MKVFLACHYNGKAGGLYNLIEYLHSKNHEVIQLLHPLDDYSKVPTLYQNEATNVTEETMRKNKGLINYLEDFFMSVRRIQKTELDVFIGCSNFDTVPAIFCRKVLRKKIHKLIYYPRDYSEGRFGNRIMDSIYMWIESVACKYSDATISNTFRAEEARKKLGLKDSKSIVIPNPVAIDDLHIFPKKIDKGSFIFVGDVSREHGLYELIEAITPEIRKLVIIGGGKDWDRVVDYAKKQKFKLELHENKTRPFVIDFLKKFSGIGLAPYNLESRWTYFCSPLKVGEYVVCGIPVLVSDVPEVASEVKERQLGITYHEINANEINQDIEAFDVSNFEKKSIAYHEQISVDTQLSKLPL